MEILNFIETLNAHSEKKLRFVLPDGDILKGDLHITEFKHHAIESVDCGANSHSFKETVIQLWINEHSGKEAKWNVRKALSIINKVERQKPFEEESEVFFEFGDSQHPTIKYSIKDIRIHDDSLEIDFFVPSTSCKPILKLSGKELSGKANCCHPV